jgi:hypothetical protein
MSARDVEFECVDCGCRVVMFGTRIAPDPRRCGVCNWIVRTLPVADQPAIRERLGRQLKPNTDALDDLVVLPDGT